MAINYHTVTHNISHVKPLLPLPPPEIAPCIRCYLSPQFAIANAILLPPLAALPSAVAASTAVAF
jgi:hypothetical protein